MMKKYQIEVEFIEPLLGTVPKDPEVYKSHILKRAALDDDEIAQELNSVEKIEEKGWTGFHRANGSYVLYDYVVKGFLKDCCGMLRRVSNTESSKLTAFKKVIDGLVFIKPRQIPLIIPEGDEIIVIERPLRAQTPQGERVTLARSDACPAGTTLSFDLLVLGQVSAKLLKEWFDYGELRGFGQWRNAGYGAFNYRMEKGK